MLHASYARRRTGCLEVPGLCYMYMYMYMYYMYYVYMAVNAVLY